MTLRLVFSISGTQFYLFLVEPNSYRTMVARSVNSSQLAQDYIMLKTLLQSVRYYSRANLYGPNIGRPRKNAILLLDGWVTVAGYCILILPTRIMAYQTDKTGQRIITIKVCPQPFWICLLCESGIPSKVNC